MLLIIRPIARRLRAVIDFRVASKMAARRTEAHSWPISAHHCRADRGSLLRLRRDTGFIVQPSRSQGFLAKNFTKCGARPVLRDGRERGLLNLNGQGGRSS